MATNTDTLRDIYLAVAGREPITERQHDGPSHEPIDQRVSEFERELRDATQQDLDDALDVPIRVG
jgi:hypothetical protein